ncbi:hypothetical protein STCU_04935 [Strigomonas culicis]|uniref:Uncharacterized protein n=1 Tax=Strigomonas culicis TaxID=28005 RepID=S9TV58_9TRYP|nr:hypothetical protein STCU_09163 [Strigomonas culicis]EPY20443.1 hypothetical protein STCU_08992 [Strigomonas culicis]EPY28679.1 hypothetical protein STCU_04935 [Strigomonas culicis]|eukprot:EPY20089.1 hypothetical protein STCU_09163 [Strigomonas culicis]
MSELSEFLTLAQLDKHYELIDFLSKHPNEEFTISQLDYFLPRGASIQRFPLEWLTYMEEGKCSNRNVEVYRKAPEKKVRVDAAEEEASGLSSLTLAYREHQRQVVLLCRRPEVTTLAQLQQLLKKPSAQMDSEDCVALHTDQIIIAPHLIRQAQRSGIAYYFPDKQSRAETHGVNEERNKGASRMFETGESAADVVGAADRAQYLALPPGIYLKSNHCTHRGVSLREACGLPTTLEVGEELYLTLDDSNARRLQLLDERAISQAPLTVACDLVGVAADAPRPLEMRMEKSNYAVPKPDNTGTFRAFKVFIMIQAACKGKGKLVLKVNGDEHIIDMEVKDKECGMPGVLVACEREPEGVYIEPKLLLADFLLAPPSVLSVPYLAQQCREASPATGEAGRAPAQGERVVAPTAEKGTASAAPGVGEVFDALSLVPLPWWLNAAPAAAALRDVTHPPEESLHAAQETILVARSLKESHRLAEARLRMSLEEEKRTKGAKRARNVFSTYIQAVNRHMLHFGLDTLVPFKKPETHEA